MENKEEEKQEVVEDTKEIVEEKKEIVEENKKNKIVLLVSLIAIVIAAFALVFIINNVDDDKKDEKETKPEEQELKPLPLPEVTGGQRGELGIDKNINESNIDEYLNRPDSVYRDMRMLDDPAKYENIGGDRFLSGYIKGFEVIPLPYLIPVTGLPQEVGNTYSGVTLFDVDEDGKYIPLYEESMSIIEKIFPKDKVIFLMCGGGGYAGMTKAFLVSLGWDATKIYNIGGFWYYDGNNKIEVPRNNDTFDFSNVPYHEIKFSELTEIKREIKLPAYLDDIYYNNRAGKGIKNLSLSEYKDAITASLGTPAYAEVEKEVEEATTAKGNTINEMIKNKESFVINVYNDDLCWSSAEDDVDIPTNMRALADKNNFYYYNLGLKVYKKTDLYKKIKYAPTVIIIIKGEVVAYIDAESDEDLKYSNSREEFNKWFESYVHVKK